MLVLSRKAGEKLVIGEDIVVTISKLSGSRVSLSIDAPSEVAIARGELLDRASKSDGRNQASGQGTSESASLHIAAHHA